MFVIRVVAVCGMYTNVHCTVGCTQTDIAGINPSHATPTPRFQRPQNTETLHFPKTETRNSTSHRKDWEEYYF